MIQLIKKNRNELLKLLIFIISTIVIYFITENRLENLILWPYEKQTRLCIVMFACVFMEFGIYYTMKPSESFLKMLYKFIPPFAMAVFFLFIDSDKLNYIPFLLPIVLFTVFYDVTNAFLFQAYVCVLYCFTVTISEEILILYLFYSILVIFLVKHSDTLVKYIFSGIISIITYVLVSYIYQYMTFERVKISTVLTGFIPLIISLIPLYIKFILKFINQQYLNKSLVRICDDENELLLMLMDKDSNAYFHSVQVADIAVRAAKRLNANVNLVNAAARFHEIGRLKSRNYVSAGIEIMRKNRFPLEIIRIVKEHNSKSNKPKSLESAIVMLADTIETTLNKIIETKGYNIDKKKIVESVIDLRFDSGVLDDAVKDAGQYKEIRKVFISLY